MSTDHDDASARAERIDRALRELELNVEDVLELSRQVRTQSAAMRADVKPIRERRRQYPRLISSKADARRRKP